MANALCMENAENLVEVRDLVVKFRTDEGIVSAVNSVSYDIPIGKTMGVVGESGCGKSVTSNAIMRILPENGWIASGSILFNSHLGVFDIARLPDKDKRLVQLHGREMAMIFQEPMTSFCPVYTIGNQIIDFSSRFPSDVGPLFFYDSITRAAGKYPFLVLTKLTSFRFAYRQKIRQSYVCDTQKQQTQPNIQTKGENHYVQQEYQQAQRSRGPRGHEQVQDGSRQRG